MSSIERSQVPIYFVAVLLDAALGKWHPELATALEPAIWPVVGTLLYFTFLQVPLLHFRQALTDTRFLAAMLTANFVFVPLIVWLLMSLLPDSLPIRLGVASILLSCMAEHVRNAPLFNDHDSL